MPKLKAPKHSSFHAQKKPMVAPLEPASKSSPWLNAVLVLVLMALVFVAFWPVLQTGFLGFDDSVYVTANPQVQRGLSWRNVAWAFETFTTGNWHPLTWLSHMLDCQIFGPNAWGHHFTSLLFHALATVFAFFALQKFTGATWRSFIVAALFGLHPLRVESVAWIAERKDVLCAFFWMLTLLAYGGYVEKRKKNSRGIRVFYVLVLFAFSAALLSKAMAVPLPFALLLLDYWPLRRFGAVSTKRLWLEKIPLFTLAAAACVMTIIAQRSGGAVSAELPWSGRVENLFVSYAAYLGKIFWPTQLVVIYPHPGGWPMWRVLFSATVLAAITVFVLRLKRRGYLAVGWFWFLGTLVPVIGLMQVGIQSMADRYTYLPSFGIFMAIVWGAFDLLRARRVRVLVPASAMAMAGCIWLTRQQLAFWQNEEVLFRHALAVTANNIEARHHLALALMNEGRLDEAEKELLAVAKADPRAETFYNLGVLLERKHAPAEAANNYRRALLLKPDFWPALQNLGAALVQAGQFDEGIAKLKDAARLQPANAQVRNGVGVCYAQSGRIEEAIPWFRAAVERDPEYRDARANLAQALMVTGKLDEAATEYQAVLQLQPNDASTRNHLGEIYLRQGRFPEAIAQFEAALKLQPGNSSIQANLKAARDGANR